MAMAVSYIIAIIGLLVCIVVLDRRIEDLKERIRTTSVTDQMSRETILNDISELERRIEKPERRNERRKDRQ